MSIKERAAAFLNKRLVPEWKQAWKWLSVQLAILAGFVAAVVTSHPEAVVTLLQFLPVELKPLVPVFVAAVPILVRLFNQNKKAE